MAFFKPQYALILLTAMMSFYMYAMFNTDFLQQTYGVSKNSYPALLWLNNWLAYTISWILVPVVIFLVLNFGNDEKLRSLCQFVLYGVSISFGGLIFTGSKSRGGVQIDSENFNEVVANFVFVMVLYIAVTSGPAMQPSGEFILKPSSASKAALILFGASAAYWFFDFTTSPLEKFISAPTSQLHEPVFRNLCGYQSNAIMHAIIMVIFTLAYGNERDRRAMLLYYVVDVVVVEGLVRFGTFGSSMTEAVLEEGTIGRVVLGAIGILALVVGGKKQHTN